MIGRIKSLEHRTDPIKHMNRATKKSLSSVKHFSIQYPFEAKLAKTQKKSLKLCYDEREKNKEERASYYKHEAI